MRIFYARDKDGYYRAWTASEALLDDSVALILISNYRSTGGISKDISTFHGGGYEYYMEVPDDVAEKYGVPGAKKTLTKYSPKYDFLSLFPRISTMNSETLASWNSLAIIEANNASSIGDSITTANLMNAATVFAKAYEEQCRIEKSRQEAIEMRLSLQGMTPKIPFYASPLDNKWHYPIYNAIKNEFVEEITDTPPAIRTNIDGMELRFAYRNSYSKNPDVVTKMKYSGYESGVTYYWENQQSCDSSFLKAHKV